MTHILARHHPEYWTGDYNGYGKDPLSMLDPGTFMRDIEDRGYGKAMTEQKKSGS